MYAIVKSGGKQYRVKKGASIAVDLLDAEVGSTIQFEEVLYFFDGEKHFAGAPALNNCTVTGKLVGHIKDDKVYGMKYKRRKQSFKAWGHRQGYSLIEVQNTEMKQHKEKHQEGRHGA